TRWTRGVDAAFPASRLRGLYCGATGTRPLLLSARYRRDSGLSGGSACAAALHGSGEIQLVAPGAPAYPMAWHRNGRRFQLRSVLRLAGAVRAEAGGYPGTQPRCHRGADRQARPGDPDDAFTIRRLWLGGDRPEAQHDQGTDPGGAISAAG